MRVTWHRGGRAAGVCGMVAGGGEPRAHCQLQCPVHESSEGLIQLGERSPATQGQGTSPISWRRTRARRGHGNVGVHWVFRSFLLFRCCLWQTLNYLMFVSGSRDNWKPVLWSLWRSSILASQAATSHPSSTLFRSVTLQLCTPVHYRPNAWNT